MFQLADGTRIGWADDDDDDWGDVETLDEEKTKLSRLEPGEAFVYEFDFGDGWTHLCTVEPERVDTQETLGIVPSRPLSRFGWGDIPDQYGRRWEDDNGESEPAPDPQKRDLPPLQPGWGEPDR